MIRETQSARDRLLSAAAVLFYNDGVGATGIDAITARAGVAKQSLYNNFASKADLVNAYLDARHAEWLALYDARLLETKTPIDRILAIFDAYQDHAQHTYERGFRGCGLLNAAAELPAGDLGRQAVRAHKEEVESILARNLAELFPDDPTHVDNTAQHLAFLLEGSMSRAGLEGSSDCIMRAKVMAEILVTKR